MRSSVVTPLLAALLVPAASVPDRTTESGEARINDPVQECTPYSYPPVYQAIAAGKFPTIWQPAFILATDNAAHAKYQSIQSQIPDIPPNGIQPGSLSGDWSGFAYSPTDPNCWWTWARCTSPKISGLPQDLTILPEPSTLGYGFDDGPNCSHNAFYDYLQQNNQKATMFFIGSNVMDWPFEAQRALADGHEICVHSWSHRYMTALTNEQAFAEFYYTIKLVVGVTPTCWRPPFGDVDDRIRSIAYALGLRNIIWEYDSNDWRAGTGGYTVANVEAAYQAFIVRAQSGQFNTVGTTLLAHELNGFTMSEAIKYYDSLRAAFKYLVPVGVALNVTRPYVESDHTLPSFAQYISGTTVIQPAAASGSADPSSQAGASSSLPSSPPFVASSNPAPSQGQGSTASGGVNLNDVVHNFDPAGFLDQTGHRSDSVSVTK